MGNFEAKTPCVSDVECGQRIIRGGLAGGRKAKIGDYPYMVLLGYDPDGKVTQ